MAIVSFLFHPVQFVRDWRTLRKNQWTPESESGTLSPPTEEK